jgi:hypothetical protein
VTALFRLGKSARKSDAPEPFRMVKNCRPKQKKRLVACRSTGFLLVVNLIIVLMITIEYRNANSNYSETLPSNPHVENLPEIKLSDIDLPSRDAFDVISNRPLFVPTRRPLALPVIESEPFSIELVGTYLDRAEKTALVRLGSQDQAVWVREREFISSWQVERIDSDRLLLRRVDELRFVHLWPDRNLAQRG